MACRSDAACCACVGFHCCLAVELHELWRLRSTCWDSNPQGIHSSLTVTGGPLSYSWLSHQPVGQTPVPCGNVRCSVRDSRLRCRTCLQHCNTSMYLPASELQRAFTITTGRCRAYAWCTRQPMPLNKPYAVAGHITLRPQLRHETWCHPATVVGHLLQQRMFCMCNHTVCNTGIPRFRVV